MYYVVGEESTECGGFDIGVYIPYIHTYVRIVYHIYTYRIALSKRPVLIVSVGQVCH